MSICVHLFEAAFMLQQQNWVFAAEANGPYWSFPGGTVVKNPPASAGDTEDVGSVPGLGRALGGGHGNPLQYSCLENPMDRERTLAGWSPWGHKESWQTEQLNIHIYDLALQKEFADPCRRNQVSLRSNLKLWEALCSYSRAWDSRIWGFRMSTELTLFRLSLWINKRLESSSKI